MKKKKKYKTRGFPLPTSYTLKHTGSTSLSHSDTTQYKNKQTKKPHHCFVCLYLVVVKLNSDLKLDTGWLWWEQGRSRGKEFYYNETTPVKCSVLVRTSYSG